MYVDASLSDGVLGVLTFCVLSVVMLVGVSSLCWGWALSLLASFSGWCGTSS